MPYNYTAEELTPYRNDPNKRIAGTGGPGNPRGLTYAEYMAQNGGGGAPADWLKADQARKDQEKIDAEKPSQVTNILYRRRDYIRSLMEGYGKTALADEERGYKQNQGGLNEDLRRRGLGSTTVRDAMQNRLTESHNRSRSSIYENISTQKANAEYGLTGDIAANLSHEQDVKANYVGQAAFGNAQSKAQQQGQLLQAGVGVASLAALALLV